jgi:hypothetical protein
MVAEVDMPFCFDTGATSHISPIHTDFVELKPISPKEIRGVNGYSIPAIGIGKIKLRCRKGRKFTLQDALFAPQAALQLISVGRLGDEGCKTTFKVKRCRVFHNHKVITDGT